MPSGKSRSVNENVDMSAAKLSPLRRRNRQALLNAAAELMQEGIVPTIADAADRAEISRATAYRYFPSPEQLQNEAALDAIAKRIGTLADHTEAGSSIEDTVETLVLKIYDMVLENELAFRTMLRHSLDPNGGGRGGRRQGWIEKVLDASGVSVAVRQRAVPALAILCGIEARIVLADVCGLADDEGRKTLAWAARALASAAIKES